MPLVSPGANVGISNQNNKRITWKNLWNENILVTYILQKGSRPEVHGARMAAAFWLMKIYHIVSLRRSRTDKHFYESGAGKELKLTPKSCLGGGQGDGILAMLFMPVWILAISNYPWCLELCLVLCSPKPNQGPWGPAADSTLKAMKGSLPFHPFEGLTGCVAWDPMSWSWFCGGILLGSDCNLTPI